MQKAIHFDYQLKFKLPRMSKIKINIVVPVYKVFHERNHFEDCFVFGSPSAQLPSID